MLMNVGSRRAVRDLISAGRVAVDGQVVTRFAHPIEQGTVVLVDGTRVGPSGPRTILLLNKPKKHLTALEDGPDLPGLGRYLPDDSPQVFPVGRLDVNSEGALLLTNDGALARRVLHPDWALPRRYAVKIRGHLESDDPGLARIAGGMTVGGTRYLPAPTRILDYRTRATWVEITLTEGKHREIRRMCHACRYQIVKLRRTAIGPIELGDLKLRCVRHLTSTEVAALDAAVGMGVFRGLAGVSAERSI